MTPEPRVPVYSFTCIMYSFMYTCTVMYTYVRPHTFTYIRIHHHVRPRHVYACPFKSVQVRSSPFKYAHVHLCTPALALAAVNTLTRHP